MESNNARSENFLKSICTASPPYAILLFHRILYWHNRDVIERLHARMQMGLQPGEKLKLDDVFEFLQAVCTNCERPGHCSPDCQQESAAAEEEDVLSDGIDVVQDLEAFAQLLRDIDDAAATLSTEDTDEGVEVGGGAHASLFGPSPFSTAKRSSKSRPGQRGGKPSMSSASTAAKPTAPAPSSAGPSRLPSRLSSSSQPDRVQGSRLGRGPFANSGHAAPLNGVLPIAQATVLHGSLRNDLPCACAFPILQPFASASHPVAQMRKRPHAPPESAPRSAERKTHAPPGGVPPSSVKRPRERGVQRAEQREDCPDASGPPTRRRRKNPIYLDPCFVTEEPALKRSKSSRKELKATQ